MNRQPSYAGVINALGTEQWTPWSKLIQTLFQQQDTAALRSEASQIISHLITLKLVFIEPLSSQDTSAQQKRELRFKKRDHIKQREVPHVYLPE